ncbi:MAG: hypothetical protein FWE37_04530 [Spirochaetaceae bacterium]|nr:hypothetical protein [Spirochaetaceae bacterium]
MLFNIKDKDFKNKSFYLIKSGVTKPEQLAAYTKASLLGKEPLKNYPSNLSNLSLQPYLNKNKVKKEAVPAKAYQQKKIDFFYINALDLHCSVINSVSAFSKESSLDSGIVVNFLAA